jgi:hypothetical protein
MFALCPGENVADLEFFFTKFWIVADSKRMQFMAEKLIYIYINQLKNNELYQVSFVFL